MQIGNTRTSSDTSDPSTPRKIEDAKNISIYNNVISFTLFELETITKSFRADYVLGEGGFGTVYKGYIDENVRVGLKSLPVAVKVLNKDGHQGHREWLVGLSESIKSQFWEDLDSMVSAIPISEKLFIGGDLNGHVGTSNVGFERVHGGFGRLGTKEGEKDIYRMARIREQKTRDINQIKCIKDGVDRLLVRDEEIKDRWREYFDKLFNGEEEGPILELDDSFDDNNRRFVRRIQETEIEEVLKRMKSGKAMGPDGIPIEDYTAKLSDFGLAKAGPEGDETHVSTRVMGTYGYAAPEYVMTGHLTARSDVYSFGVVLLELLTGRKSIDKSRPNREQSLVDWALPKLCDKRRLLQIMDPKLEGQYPVRAAYKACSLAYYCLNHNPKARPLMSDVVETLEPLQGSGGSDGAGQSSGLTDYRVRHKLTGNIVHYRAIPNPKCSPAVPTCRVR
ncbi:hypothetical protein PR202_gb00695 [Eleusine coracana subsp. coracana]|uniref:Protein kinase domain-containing protein n=1 Tax=Eleusine coracana subsp. coracana TaxID=191504 RepID=A0AAV5DUP6_ELECO|nr:hypothetical protein PR202_gb00695 [Eleusine coracana subsp. coracana]